MKCGAQRADEVGLTSDIVSSEWGWRGDELGFPQSETTLPIPLGELQSLIQRQVQGLAWTAEQVKVFVSGCFGGRNRSQLRDDELLTLLYHLRVEALDP